jgi:S1-C subfamily serine protease
VGGSASLDVISKGRKRTVSLALMAAPETVQREATEIGGNNPFAGATMANLSPAVAEELSIKDTAGVVVMETKAYSPARRFGLQPGDVLVRVNGEPVRNVKQLLDLLRQARGWDFVVRRGGVERRAIVRG